MKIAIIAAGLALAGGLAAAAPAEAQYYGHHDGGYRDGYRGGGFRHDGYRGGYGHRGYGYGYGYGYRHRGYGPGYGYGPRYGYGGYRHGRVVCTYHHGFRRCFRGY